MVSEWSERRRRKIVECADSPAYYPALFVFIPRACSGRDKRVQPSRVSMASKLPGTDWYVTAYLSFFVGSHTSDKVGQALSQPISMGPHYIVIVSGLSTSRSPCAHRTHNCEVGRPRTTLGSKLIGRFPTIKTYGNSGPLCVWTMQ